MHPKLSILEKSFRPSTLSKIESPLLDCCQVELWVKRDDLLHPIISGNKWRKLKYILDFVLRSGVHTVISMGGAYSNHLHALAYVGFALGVHTIGFIRGEQPKVLNSTLVEMQQWGMELKFLARSEYRFFRQFKNWRALPGLAPGQYWLPEGGAQELALKGVAELVDEIHMPFDTICVPCGTGTTMAGISQAVAHKAKVLGFSALKNGDYINQDIESLLNSSIENNCINQDYHFGGFAKLNTQLTSFMESFELSTSIPLDPVYTGKMFFGIDDLLKKQYFKPGQRIIALHTGGLQGKRGFDQLTSA